MPERRDLFVAALALGLLPFALSVIGLGVTSATEVVVFALALALNILVGYSGLTSFGHGAWFGLAAYAAGMAQRDLLHGGFFAPLALGLAVVIALAWAFGFLILRREGVPQIVPAEVFDPSSSQRCRPRLRVHLNDRLAAKGEDFHLVLSDPLAQHSAGELVQGDRMCFAVLVLAARDPRVPPLEVHVLPLQALDALVVVLPLTCEIPDCLASPRPTSSDPKASNETGELDHAIRIVNS